MRTIAMRYAKTALLAALVLMLGITVLTACKKITPDTMTPTAVVTELSREKDQYVNELQARIDEYQVKIDALSEKAGAMTGTAKDDLDRKIATLKAKQEEARGKIEQIKAATEETWDKVKAGSDLILSDLETLYNDALSLVK
jgi:peptidoglycan hydrolase CwlO-like protein